MQQPPLQKGRGLAEKIIFFSCFRLNFCVCACGYSMTLNTNEKKNFLYLLTFIDKIISVMVVLYLACQTPKIDNLCCSLKNSSYQ